MYKNIAIATNIKAIQNETVVKNQYPSKSKVVALWLLDENLQLYCQWIPQSNDINK